MIGPTARALFYLQRTSWAGRIRSRLKRLRQPKYLVGALVGAAYVYFFFLRRVTIGHPPAMHAPLPGTPGLAGAMGTAGAPAFADAAATIGAGVFMTLLLLNWMVPRAGGPSLVFSEAEIAFLFPAPIRRRTLVHYRLLTQLVALLLGSVFLALFSNRWAWARTGSPLSHVLGWWIILSTLTLHGIAASFVIAHLAARGVPAWVTRLAALAAVLGLLALTLYVHGPLQTSGPMQDFRQTMASLQGMASLPSTAPLSWLLAPGRLVIAPFLAADLNAFALALPAALALLAAHYGWVLLVAVNFEEQSIVRAEKRAARAAAMRSRGSRTVGPAKARPARFRLRAAGRPEIAFLWKNLLATPGFVSPRAALLLAVAIAAGCSFMGAQPAYRGGLHVVTVCAIVAAVYALLLGPQVVRCDLRADLLNADLLKSYPLRGWQIVLGELLTPVAILSTVVWLALLAFALSQDRLPWPVGPAIAGLALLVPALAALQVLMPNGVAVLLPAWSQSVRTEQGLDVLGQRLIFMLLQMLVMVFLLLPAVIGAVAVWFAASLLLGATPFSAGLAAAAGTLAVLLTELGFAIFWLGGRFERLDISAELRP